MPEWYCFRRAFAVDRLLEKSDGRQALERQTATRAKADLPRATLHALPSQGQMREWHQFSFAEYQKRQMRAKAPEPVVPTFKMGKPKPPGAQLTQQIERQMRPRPPGRKH